MDVAGLIETLGYPFVLLYSILESALLLPFTPGELVILGVAVPLLVDGFRSALILSTVVTIGTILGNVLVYWVSLRFGRPGLETLFDWFHLPHRYIYQMEDQFERYGRSVVLWGRLIPFVRAYISIGAGLGRMPFREYVLFTSIGVAFFNYGFILLVWRGIDSVVEQIRGFAVLGETAVPSVIFVLLVLFGIFRFRV